MSMNTKLEQYCVTAKLYVWADSEKDAARSVYNDLEFLCEVEARISGYEVPTTADAVKCEET
jgi:hypothetical protein